jgi:hypothetical protein
MVLRVLLALQALTPACVSEQGEAWSRTSSELEEEEGPCRIERVPLDDMSTERFASEYKEKKPVIILTGLDYNAQLRAIVDRQPLIAEYGDMNVTVSIAPERDLPKNYSAPGRFFSVPFREYIEEMMPVSVSLDTPGEQSYYLFGNKGGDRFPELLESYRVPPFDATLRPDKKTYLSLGLAGRNSGVPFHEHGPGWSEVLHGRKRWFLYPRDDPAPLYDPLTSTYENEWLREAYPTLSPEQKPIECTLSAGELHAVFPVHVGSRYAQSRQLHVLCLVISINSADNANNEEHSFTKCSRASSFPIPTPKHLHDPQTLSHALWHAVLLDEQLRRQSCGG